MKIQSSALLCTSILALLCLPATAKPDKDKGQGKGKPHKTEHPGKGSKGKSDKHPGKSHGKAHKFSDKEHLEVKNFFAPDNRKNLPPGLRKNLERGKPLPPGWQKKVTAGQVINADWLKLMTPVSYDLLPGIKAVTGTRLYHHDDRVIQVSEESRVILDVIRVLAR